MNERQRLNVDEAAVFLGLKKSYLYKLCHLGKIPFYRPTGGKSWFDLADLDKYMDRGRRSADYELADKADAFLCERR